MLSFRRYSNVVARTKITNLIAAHKPMMGLAQPWYLDPDIYNYEMTKFWPINWLFAGYAYQLSNVGSYFTYQMGSNSVIIIRNRDGIQAFHNVCRHRGSKLLDDVNCNKLLNLIQCTKHDAIYDHDAHEIPSCNKINSITCPYHQWKYSIEGQLIKSRDMDNFDKTVYGLKPVHIKNVAGLLFLNMDPNPIPHFDFTPIQKLFTPQLTLHGLQSHAKVIRRIVYRCEGNWKLLMENFAECFHCPANHPEYNTTNHDISFSYDPNTKIRGVDPNAPNAKDIETYIKEKTELWQRALGDINVTCTVDNSFPGQGHYRLSRNPLREGWLSETMNGRPASMLRMGTLPLDDIGILRLRVVPGFWAHLSPDYAMIAHVRPININITEVITDWLVHHDAKPGIHYDIDNICHVWDMTNKQDFLIVKRNQQGVESTAYEPGPLCVKKEQGVDRFIKWYMTHLNHVVSS